MKLLFRQKIFSILDSFEVFDEEGNVVYTVKSVLDLKHHFQVFDSTGKVVGELKEKFFSIKHTFIMYENGVEFGQIVKEITFFKPKFTVHAKGYEVDGDIMEWDYTVKKNGEVVATLSKEIFNWSDTYTIDVRDDCVVDVLMIALAIDAVKCDHDED